MSYKQIVEGINEQLLLSAGLRRCDFADCKERLKQRPSFEDYVFPFQIAEAEYKIKTDIDKIVSNNITGIESSEEISPIDIGKVSKISIITILQIN